MAAGNAGARGGLRIKEQHVGDIFIGLERRKIRLGRNSQCLNHRLSKARPDEGHAFGRLGSVQLDEIGIGSGDSLGNLMVRSVCYERDHAHTPAQGRGERSGLIRLHAARRIAVKNEPREIGTGTQDGARIFLPRDAADFYLHHRAPLIVSRKGESK